MDAFTHTMFPRKILTMILAGGQGERLYPLTKDRTKPSVPFAGSYRIIDFTLSNCLNSGLRQMFVLTQYKSQSLNRHIREGWNILHRDLGEFIETVPPQQRLHTQWYNGTADAIYQNIYILDQMRPDLVLLLSGDHIYRMNYVDLIHFHIQKQAKVTISSYEYPREKASSFGVMHVDGNDRILDFIEKPADPPSIPGKAEHALVNMGVYVFDTRTLVKAVIDDAKDPHSSYDIGKNVLPRLLRQQDISLFSYHFSRQKFPPYWRDVGSIASYYEASMALVDGRSPINLFSEEWPFRTDSISLPPSVFSMAENPSGQVRQSMIGAGCVIEGHVRRSIISPQVTIKKEATVEGCVIFNHATIGKGCKIRNTIIDKYVCIPDGTEIGYNVETDRQQFLVDENHIVVIPKRMEVV